MAPDAITELAESQASDRTIMAIAGHVSPKMLARYSHVRLEATRKVLDALSAVGPGGSYDTKHDTNVPSAGPQVIEIDGRPVGSRTPDLYRVNLSWLGASFEAMAETTLLCTASVRPKGRWIAGSNSSM
jgi:hypothetical protein